MVSLYLDKVKIHVKTVLKLCCLFAVFERLYENIKMTSTTSSFKLYIRARLLNQFIINCIYVTKDRCKFYIKQPVNRVNMTSKRIIKHTKRCYSKLTKFSEVLNQQERVVCAIVIFFPFSTYHLL